MENLNYNLKSILFFTFVFYLEKERMNKYIDKYNG